MVTTNEFSHVVKISEVGNHSRNLRLSADEAARNGLMARFDLAALGNLEAEISLKHEADAVIATGRFTASLAQFCIATHDPVPAKLDELLDLSAKGLHSVLILAVGERDAANDYMANAAKVRYSKDELFVRM